MFCERTGAMFSESVTSLIYDIYVEEQRAVPKATANWFGIAQMDWVGSQAKDWNWMSSTN